MDTKSASSGREMRLYFAGFYDVANEPRGGRKSREEAQRKGDADLLEGTALCGLRCGTRWSVVGVRAEKAAYSGSRKWLQLVWFESGLSGVWDGTQLKVTLCALCDRLMILPQ